MNFNPRILHIESVEQAKAELTKIGCDQAGVGIMAGKAVFTVVKLENIPTKAANLLKQTFLAKGGEVALNRGSADLTVNTTDALICATDKQYRIALAQLRLQPWGLPKLAAALEEALRAHKGFPAREYVWPDRNLTIQPHKTLIMGILNLTPDSFSDGGRYNSLDNALRQAERLIAGGADIIDIGAESTRPYGGSEEISAEEELDRLLPILERVLKLVPAPVSVDTYKAEVAQAALQAGAHMINDVWGLQKDRAMAAVAAAHDAPVIVMHNQKGSYYEKDIMSHIREFLQQSIDIGVGAEISYDRFIIDPGIGFGKVFAQNLEVLSRLQELKSLGCPILLGTSRKRFIGEALGGAAPEERLEGTAATVALGIAGGANIVRVHDVDMMSKVARVADTIMGGSGNE